MLTRCRIDGTHKYIMKNIDGRKEVFNAMWITRGGKLAGATFQRCDKNKHIAYLIDGPYFLRVLPVRRYVHGATPKRKESVKAPTPQVVTQPIVYDVKQDGTVDIHTQPSAEMVLKIANRKREFKTDV